MNVFSRGTKPFVDVDGEHSVITPSAEAKAALADLPEYMQMEAYVSLGKDWTMEELENFAAQQDGYLGWVGVRRMCRWRKHGRSISLLCFNTALTIRIFTQD